MSREGYAYVILQDKAGNFVKNEETDVFVPAHRTFCALNGDIVKLEVFKTRSHRSKNQRNEGRVVQIVERCKTPYIGTLHLVRRQAWALVESRNMPYDIMLPYDESLLEYKGQKIAVVVDSWDNWSPSPKGHITNILGPAGENNTEMHAILVEYGLPYEFPEEVEAEASKISGRITKAEIAKRSDYRDAFTFTIDPAEAKDFDDAVSYEKLPDGLYSVGVHIADVSHYVREGSLIDTEARERGTSVYLVDRTVPMLPEKLCNELCSLVPNKDRLTYSVQFILDEKAHVVDYKISKSVIHSDYRLAYEDAQAIIEGTDHKDPKLTEAVRSLWTIASKLRENRFRKGAINFERPEMKIEVDAQGKPVRVYQKISKEANFLIEEFMLLANRTVAETISKRKKPFVYRVHDEPNNEKLVQLGKFVKTFGYSLGPIGNSSQVASSLNTLVKQSKGTAVANAFEMMMLRSMSKAKYTTDNIGHYGLAFADYTHFTSPIRRYPDLIVHRLLHEYLDAKKPLNVDKDVLEGLCVHSSQREGLATDAERSSIKYKMIEFMSDKIGQEFEAEVSGVSQWGFYAEVLPTHIEGMVALRDIPFGFYEFDEKAYALKSYRKKSKITLGTKVRVKVKSTSIEQRYLDFELIEIIK